MAHLIISIINLLNFFLTIIVGAGHDRINCTQDSFSKEYARFVQGLYKVCTRPVQGGLTKGVTSAAHVMLSKHGLCLLQGLK